MGRTIIFLNRLPALVEPCSTPLHPYMRYRGCDSTPPTVSVNLLCRKGKRLSVRKRAYPENKGYAALKNGPCAFLAHAQYASCAACAFG